MTWTPKDPASVEHFGLDFTLMLEAGDSVTSLVGVTIDQGDTALVISSPTLSGAMAVFALSGGTVDTTYVLRGEVTTAGGERLELSAPLLVRRRQ